VAYKEEMIAEIRSIGLVPRSWIIDGQVYALQLPHATGTRQNAGHSRLIVCDSSCSYIVTSDTCKNLLWEQTSRAGKRQM